MNSNWRFLNTGSYSGAMNMALDEILLKGVQNGGRPVVRFYTWDPPAISFGYAQDPYNEVDVDRCTEAGIDLVRRPTGGRAVLHWEELTYSVVAPLNDSVSWGQRINEAYNVIGKCLVKGLQRYGVDAEIEKGQVGVVRHPRGKTATPCFSSIARSEVKLKGRKLIGSAQRRFSDAMLQHGSIIIGNEHERLTELLLLGDHERLEWKKELANKSVSLRDYSENEIDQRHLIDCLFAGFSQEFNCSINVENISEEERGHASDRMDCWRISPSLDRLAR
tara:strand:+ start:231 stop:1061 length:831 start_codon:yes stop_codon:yes gene_type:complete